MRAFRPNSGGVWLAQGVHCLETSTARWPETGSKTGMYTAENIRTLRPSTIKVRTGKKVIEGRIGGWLLDFPIVTFGDHGQVEVATATLSHCLNTHTPVIIL